MEATALIEFVRHNPELAFFFTLGGGFLLGSIKLGSQKLGAVLGVLIVGLIVGQTGVVVSDSVKWVFFYFFLFAVGYKCGPQFIHGLRTSGMVQIGLTLLFVFTSVTSAIVASKLLNFDAGTGVGLFAGALTASTSLGVAADSIARLQITPAERDVLLTNLSTAFATTYLIGMLLTVWFLSRMGPVILRSNLADDCKKLEKETGTQKTDSQSQSTYHEISVRGYVINAPELRTVLNIDTIRVEALENFYLPNRVFVEKIVRNGNAVDVDGSTVLLDGDLVAVTGRDEVLASNTSPLHKYEVSNRQLLDLPNTTAVVTITNSAFDNKTIAEVAATTVSRGVFLLKHERGGLELPRTLQTTVQRGDRVVLSGITTAVENIGELLGRIERLGKSTNVALISATIVLGGLIGIPALNIAGAELGLGISVGVLIGGLVVGWLQSTHRNIAPIPTSVLWFFDSVGLAGFVAVTALTVGSQFLESIQHSGVALVASSIVVALLPHALVMLVGKYALKIHPGILLGINAGAGTNAPSLAAIQEAAHSTVPTLGYSVTYALGNILLALSAAVIVAVLK